MLEEASSSLHVLLTGPCLGELKPRKIALNGRMTSVRLEDEVWEAFRTVAQTEGISLSTLAGLVDKRRAEGASFSAALRSFTLSYYVRRRSSVPASSNSGLGLGEAVAELVRIYQERDSTPGTLRSADKAPARARR